MESDSMVTTPSGGKPKLMCTHPGIGGAGLFHGPPQAPTSLSRFISWEFQATDQHNCLTFVPAGRSQNMLSTGGGV